MERRPRSYCEDHLLARCLGKTSFVVTRYHETLNETKKRLILAALAESGGNVTKAGALLGLHPNYLHRLMSNLGLRV